VYARVALVILNPVWHALKAWLAPETDKPITKEPTVAEKIVKKQLADRRPQRKKGFVKGWKN